MHKQHTYTYTSISRSQSYFSSQIHLNIEPHIYKPNIILVYRTIRFRRNHAHLRLECSVKNLELSYIVTASVTSFDRRYLYTG